MNRIAPYMAHSIERPAVTMLTYAKVLFCCSSFFRSVRLSATLFNLLQITTKTSHRVANNAGPLSRTWTQCIWYVWDFQSFCRPLVLLLCFAYRFFALKVVQHDRLSIVWRHSVSNSWRRRLSLALHQRWYVYEQKEILIWLYFFLFSFFFF